MTHEEVFFNFVIQHDYFKDMFGTKPADQKIIAIIGENNITEANAIVIDPNWDSIYESFLNIDHDKESVDYIQSLLESYNINETQTYIDGLVKKMIEKGIVADKVYVHIPSTADKSFYHEVIEV